MKKFLVLLSVMVLSVSMLVGCGLKQSKNELTVYFVPSRNPAEIQKATEPLSKMLKEELSKVGYNFDNIKVEVGTSFEAVGESLSSGAAQVGFIPGGTYVIYDEDVDVALTATRFGLNHDSDNPADWNLAPTENTDNQVKYYRALVIAGPSEKGQKLSQKINNGEKLTLDDIQNVTWGVSSNSTSPAGYIYPSLWLKENFGISITDLKSKVALDNYATSLSQLASGQIDVMVTYADARLDYAEQWNSNFGRTASVWEETNIIGVTDGIYNDTISVTKEKEMTPELKSAIQQAFINIGKTDEGQKIISIYSHKGYEIGNPSDYEAERQAQQLIKSMQ